MTSRLQLAEQAETAAATQPPEFRLLLIRLASETRLLDKLIGDMCDITELCNRDQEAP